MDQKTEQATRDDPRSSNDNRERTPVAMVRKPIVPKKVSFSEKLREARPSKKIVVALMVATAVLTMLVGFNYGGWVTGGISQQRVTTGRRMLSPCDWCQSASPSSTPIPSKSRSSWN